MPMRWRSSPPASPHKARDRRGHCRASPEPPSPNACQSVLSFARRQPGRCRAPAANPLRDARLWRIEWASCQCDNPAFQRVAPALPSYLAGSCCATRLSQPVASRGRHRTSHRATGTPQPCGPPRRVVEVRLVCCQIVCCRARPQAGHPRFFQSRHHHVDRGIRPSAWWSLVCRTCAGRDCCPSSKLKTHPVWCVQGRDRPSHLAVPVRRS